MDGGLYIGLFNLPRAKRIRVGRLGRFALSAGVYLYVGSAQRNLQARLARHARRRKRLRWHIDYLSVKARMLGAIVVAGAKAGECRLAARLARRLPLAVPGFGSSDCSCGGHLFQAGSGWGAAGGPAVAAQGVPLAVRPTGRRG